jgi:excisionase family DNA binding protein
MQRRNLLSHKEAADLLGVSVHRIAKWLDKGMIPYVQIGMTRQIDREALLEWYESQMVYPDNNGEPARQQSKTDEGS